MEGMHRFELWENGGEIQDPGWADSGGRKNQGETAKTNLGRRSTNTKLQAIEWKYHLTISIAVSNKSVRT